MLTRIRLSFQRHCDLELDLHPITAIIGETDQGKSSILRALRWVCLNRPAGNSFIPWGTSLAEAYLDVDGKTIARIKGNGINAYGIDQGEPLKSFGSEVPTEVARWLNVSDANFQNQHEGPFWLDLTPGQVAKELNGIVDLEVIDASLSNAAAVVRMARTASEVSVARLSTAKASRAALAWVPDAETAMAALTARNSAMSAKRDKAAKLALHINKVVAYGKVHQQAKIVAVGIANAVSKASMVMDAKKKVERLAQSLENLKKLKALTAVGDAAGKLFDDLSTIVATKVRAMALDASLNRLRTCRDTLADVDRDWRTVSDELEEANRGACPLCGRKDDA